MDKWTPEEMLRVVDGHRCTHTHMVPTQFHRLLALPDTVRARYDVSSLRHAIHGAAPCPDHVKRAMIEWWGDCVEEYYAASEGGGAFATAEDWLKKPGTVGKAWPISELAVFDDDGNRLAPGELGTVYMKMTTGASPTTRTRPRRGRAASATSSPSATSASSTRTAISSSATARST